MSQNFRLDKAGYINRAKKITIKIMEKNILVMREIL